MFTHGRVLLAASVLVSMVFGREHAPQLPSVGSVVVVRAVPDSASTGTDPDSNLLGLGFVADSGQIIAHVPLGVDTLIVVDIAGNEFEATIVARDDSTRLVLVTVPGLTLAPYGFSHDLPESEDEVVAASQDSAGLKFVSGQILEVGLDTLTSGRGWIAHDAFVDAEFNRGAPLLNSCGEILGVVIDSINGEPGRPGGLVITAEWLLARFGPHGLTASAASAQCLTDAERAAEAEAAATEAAERAAAAEAAAQAAADRAATAEAATEEARRAAADARAAQEQAAEGQEQAQQQAAEAREQATAAQQLAEDERARYLRWISWVVGLAAAVGLLIWLFSLRSVSKARQAEVKAATLAQAAREDLEKREARDQLADQVASVFLEGTDVDGNLFALRVPGTAIAEKEGAVVGRNPFDSTLVLNHTEVSRRHFRLFARGSSVLVEDLNSTNGTKVGGVALRPGASAELREGDVLEVASLRLAVTLQR